VGVAGTDGLAALGRTATLEPDPPVDPMTALPAALPVAPGVVPKATGSEPAALPPSLHDGGIGLAPLGLARCSV